MIVALLQKKMMMTLWHIRLFSCALCLLFGPLAYAAGVRPLFDLSNPDAAPFPSNRLAQLDLRNLTNLRVDLPKPDCVSRPNDCFDVDVINTLDGFNPQPRLRIPFSGAIEPLSVNSSNVFLVSLGDTTRLRSHKGRIIGINQVVWDPQAFTLYAESDEFLKQHTTYALIITNDVRDAAGDRVEAGDFKRFLRSGDRAHPRDPWLAVYRNMLLAALATARVPPHRIVAASVFTTQSVTAPMIKIRRQIKRDRPAPADFDIAADGSRTVYPLDTLTDIVFVEQTGTAPAFSSHPMPLSALSMGSVDTIAFGRYQSPDYQTPEKYIPAIHTRTGVPRVQSVNDLYFNLYLPAGVKPANGWPVAIFGHGFRDSKQGEPTLVASSMAAHGFATIAINIVGHGGGPLSHLIVHGPGLAPLDIPAGGRGFDQNGDGSIGNPEGNNALSPRGIILAGDSSRQMAIDLMQLVRVIQEGGMDGDGDGAPDLDPRRIYYFGQSLGGAYGMMFTVVEPVVRASALIVSGGPFIDVGRLGTFRSIVGFGLSLRTPLLLNAPPLAPPLWGFEDNMPLRNQPPLTNEVAGAIDLQNYFDRVEWVSQSSNPVSFARHVRKDPLPGVHAKPLIIQFAKGDVTVPTLTTTNMVRAGDLADRTTFYRHDLAYASTPGLPKDPHAFFIDPLSPLMGPVALAAQDQIAVFFASDGKVTIDPDGPNPFFETPAVPPLPEEIDFLP